MGNDISTGGCMDWIRYPWRKPECKTLFLLNPFLMYESLIKYFNSYTTTLLTESEMELIRGTFMDKKFRKRQYFLQEGEICKYTAFIVKGAMR